MHTGVSTNLLPMGRVEFKESAGITGRFFVWAWSDGRTFLFKLSLIGSDPSDSSSLVTGMDLESCCNLELNSRSSLVVGI